MRLRRFVATSMIAIAAMGAAGAPAFADPAPAAVPNVNWTTRAEAGGVTTTVDAGVFKIADNGKTVDLIDAAGAVVVSLPLTLNLNGIEFPYTTTITDEGRTVNLVPNLAAPNLGAISVPGLPGNLGVLGMAENKVASPAEDLAANQFFTSQLALASSIGGLTGTIVGAIAGCILGGGPALLPTCLTTGVTGAGVGSVVGTIIVGGPTLIVAGIDYYNTIMAAPGTTRFAPKPTPAPAAPPAP